MTSSPKFAAAPGRYDVTTFQPMRPPVRWSSVEKRRACANGCSYVVDTVVPNARRSVTAASAGMCSIGSRAGISTPCRIAVSAPPRYVSYSPSTSPKKNRSMPASSTRRAWSVQYRSDVADNRSSAGWVHRLAAEEPLPTQACS